jgi:hypothetical protein
MSKPMFKAGLKSQGKFLVKMISLSLSTLLDKSKFVDTMNKLAEVHNGRGVKSIECKNRLLLFDTLLVLFQFNFVYNDFVDGIVGDVLFWSLRKCLGSEYDAETHKAWVRIFCSMLKVLVPNAVDWELKNGDAQIDCLRHKTGDGDTETISTGISS